MASFVDVKDIVKPEREPEVWDERIPAFNPLFSHAPEAPPVSISPAMAETDFDVVF